MYLSACCQDTRTDWPLGYTTQSYNTPQDTICYISPMTKTLDLKSPRRMPTGRLGHPQCTKETSPNRMTREGRAFKSPHSVTALGPAHRHTTSLWEGLSTPQPASSMAKAFMATSIFLSNSPTLPTNAELGRSLRRIPSVRAVARRRGLPSAG